MQQGAKATTTVLLCVAMFRPEKNQRELIEIAAGLLVALAGLVVLGQHLVLTGWLAIAVIVAVNTVAVTAPRRALHHWS